MSDHSLGFGTCKLGFNPIAPLISYRAMQLAEAVAGVEPITEDVRRPSEGLYYVIPRKTKWDLYPCRADEFNEQDHAELWEEAVARVIAADYSDGNTAVARQIYDQIRDLPYSVPRGRITVSHQKGLYYVWNGDDIESFMRVSKFNIERAFGVNERCQWKLDDHEHCVSHDRDALREVLGIKETWKAV